MVDFAKRTEAMKPSPIRALLALTSQPDVTSFAGGMPAKELFPVADFKAAIDAVMEEAGPTALQYGQTDGWAPLRKQITERMLAKNNIQCDPSEILLTAGSQQGLDFCGRIFLNPGDTVIMEAPSYLGAINAFNVCEPNYLEIPTDDGGMIMEELEKTLATAENVKLIYVIPDFQNPTGRTWSLERRKKFMEIVNKYEIPVVEDNPYGELRYSGEYQPALKSLDTKGLVIYLGTMSKILSPGVRIGWICASKDFQAKFNLLAQAAVLQTSTFAAMACSKYIDMFDLDAHVEQCRQLYSKRCALMVESMDKYFPEEVKFTRPDGGLFTWAECPTYINTTEMAAKCLEKKVAYVPGDGFFPNGGNSHCLRLNYSGASEEQIVNGIKIIGDIMKASIK